jgi:hypothetical protein
MVWACKADCNTNIFLYFLLSCFMLKNFCSKWDTMWHCFLEKKRGEKWWILSLKWEFVTQPSFKDLGLQISENIWHPEKKSLFTSWMLYLLLSITHRMSERGMVITAHIAILFSFTDYKEKSLCKTSLCFVRFSDVEYDLYHWMSKERVECWHITYSPINIFWACNIMFLL